MVKSEDENSNNKETKQGKTRGSDKIEKVN